MIKPLSILACLCTAHHVSSHPLLLQRRQDQNTTVNITTPVPPPLPVQPPLLFELTRGAPYTNKPQSIPLTPTLEDLKLTHITDDYFLKLNVGGQERFFRVDTGTGTFWVAEKNFDCYNLQGQLVGQACCGLDAGVQLNATNATAQPFYQSYEADYYARGNLTASEISFGNNTWPVVVGVADNVRAEGSRIESGVLGLAGPGLYMGEDTSPTTLRAKPFFSQFVSLFPSLPYFFTLGLSRHSADNTTSVPSYIELGGRLLRAPGIAAEGPIAIVPLLTVPAPEAEIVQPISGNSSGVVATYTTMDPGFKVNGTSISADKLPYHTTIDSGNPGLVLPVAVANAFNKQWYDQRVYSAPCSWDAAEHVQVECGATPPSLNVTYNGVDFAIDGRDLVHVGSDGRCRSVVTGTTTRGVLGVPFLKNVVTVHNIGGKRIEFQARVPY